MESRMASVMNFRLGVLHQHFEVATVLEFGPYSFCVFIELGGVIGLGKEVFQEDGMRDPDRLQVLHGAAKDSGTNVLVAHKSKLANSDLGAFLHHKSDADLGGRDGPLLGAYGGELPPVLGQQFLDRYLSLFDLGGIVLALRR